MAMTGLKTALYGAGFDVKFIRPHQRAQFLSLSKVRRSDVFMCSYPRSGNTWTRMIVACLLDPSLEDVDLDAIDWAVPAPANENQRQKSPRVFKEHSPKFDVFPRVIYNYRDGRDCVVSAYRYAMRVFGYPGTMRQFMVDRRVQIYGLWHEHVGQALAFQARYPDRICMVRYESQRKKPAEEIERIASFLGLAVTSARIESIAAMTALGRQKAKVTQDDPRKAHTLQNGHVGRWQDALEPEDLEVFEGLSSHVMRKLGYRLDTTGTWDPRGW